MSDEPSSSSFRPGVRSLVGSAADVEEGQASERSSLCEVLYSGSDSDTPRYRRRGHFEDDEELSRISDCDIIDYNVVLKDRIGPCSIPIVPKLPGEQGGQCSSLSSRV